MDVAARAVEAAVRTWDKSKDHRDDPPQVVIGMAVTREGMPVRLWTAFPMRAANHLTNVPPIGSLLDA